MKKRPTFEQACAAYVHRYTMDYVPQWASKRPIDSGGTETRYYAPQYASDQEWYDNTLFPGDVGYPFGKRDTSCYSTGNTWPLGKWLGRPYRGRAPYVSGDDVKLPVAERMALQADRAREDCRGQAA